MSGNREETLRQFCDVTGADENRSKFFLESSNWQLEEAISSFYEHGGNVDESPATGAVAPPQVLDSDSDMDSGPDSPQRQAKKGKKKSNTKFATLDSLQQESSSDEEGQAFYAGGSERSGQQILGPSKSRKDIVTEMFKSVKEQGGVVFEDEPVSSGRSRSGLFGGVGYRLGQTADDHEQVTPTGSQAQTEPRPVRLRLYREGFTVDSGALRSYTDPENAEFLNYIRRGEVPAELAAGGAVRVSLEDRRHEPAPAAAPAAAPRAFAGRGHVLGSPTPVTVGAPSAATSDAGDREANRRAAQAAVRLDSAGPLTTIQFRLADGSRITGQFNHTHTVGDLHEYVSRAEPAYQLTPFALLTAFPSVELTDRAATLADAKLLNTTLLQRLK